MSTREGLLVCMCWPWNLLTDSEVVDMRRERRRDTMDLLREAKSSNSAKLGSTPMQSSCSTWERRRRRSITTPSLMYQQACTTSLRLYWCHSPYTLCVCAYFLYMCTWACVGASECLGECKVGSALYSNYIYRKEVFILHEATHPHMYMNTQCLTQKHSNDRNWTSYHLSVYWQ